MGEKQPRSPSKREWLNLLWYMSILQIFFLMKSPSMDLEECPWCIIKPEKHVARINNITRSPFHYTTIKPYLMPTRPYTISLPPPSVTSFPTSFPISHPALVDKAFYQAQACHNALVLTLSLKANPRDLMAFSHLYILTQINILPDHPSHQALPLG